MNPEIWNIKPETAPACHHEYRTRSGCGAGTISRGSGPGLRDPDPGPRTLESETRTPETGTRSPDTRSPGILPPAPRSRPGGQKAMREAEPPMPDSFFTQPIINSPYEYPTRHWELDAEGQPTHRLIDRRRRAEFVTPIPKARTRKAPGAQDALEFGDRTGVATKAQGYDPTPIINELRGHVDRWRALPSPGDWQVTPETARLLRHWRHHFGSEARRYRPDFIVVVDDGRGGEDPLHLVVEVKGYRREDAKEKKAAMETFWVPGVNRLGTFGRWAFAELRDVYGMEEDFEAEVEAAFDGMIEGVLA